MAKTGRKIGQPTSKGKLSSGADACSYLAEKGITVSEPTLLRHVREGKLKKAGQSFLPADIDAYAATYLAADEGNDDKVNLQTRKLTAESKRIELDADMRELKLAEARGELLSKSEVEIAFAERANSLATYLYNIAKTSSPRIIKEVDGKTSKAGHLSEWLMEMFRKALDGYARPLDFSAED